MNSAKTVAERQREYRERMQALGLKELRNLWAHPDDEKRIREYVEKLSQKRNP